MTAPSPASQADQDRLTWALGVADDLGDRPGPWSLGDALDADRAQELLARAGIWWLYGRAADISPGFGGRRAAG